MFTSRLNLLACCVLVSVTACVAQNTATQASPETKNKQPIAGKTTFTPLCTNPTYPSPPPKTKPGIDSQCGLQGSGGEEANQNMAKNNFCATGTPTDMAIDDFTNLQTQVDNDISIPYGDSSQSGRQKGPAVDRGPLQTLGEGKLVRMQAYVLSGKQEGEESVNCESAVPNQPAFHDIHIELVGASDSTDECRGIIAEMIPHHRPDTWTADNVHDVSTAKLPVRVTGQLMFDSSHFPCENGAGVGDNPKRISLWEIHPIYKFEVCSSGDCSSGAGWVTLDQWVSKNGSAKRKK